MNRFVDKGPKWTEPLELADYMIIVKHFAILPSLCVWLELWSRYIIPRPLYYKYKPSYSEFNWYNLSSDPIL